MDNSTELYTDDSQPQDPFIMYGKTMHEQTLDKDSAPVSIDEYLELLGMTAEEAAHAIRLSQMERALQSL